MAGQDAAKMVREHFTTHPGTLQVSHVSGQRIRRMYFHLQKADPINPLPRACQYVHFGALDIHFHEIDALHSEVYSTTQQRRLPTACKMPSCSHRQNVCRTTLD